MVFDEAHNIMDIISQMQSISVKQEELTIAIKSIKEYLNKYGGRMLPKNIKAIKSLIEIFFATLKFITDLNAKETQVIDPIDLLMQTDLYSFDFTHLHNFFEKSDLIKKLNGFMMQ